MSVAGLVRELRCNPALLDICGFDPLPVQRRPRPTDGNDVVRMTPSPSHAIPGGGNFSRFLRSVVRVEEEDGLISAMIAELRGQLMDLLPDFGVELGCDGKAVRSWSTGVRGWEDIRPGR